MIRIADRVWQHWRNAEPVGRPGVDLLFSSAGGGMEGLNAVTGAADATIEELGERPPRETGEPFSTGACSTALVPGGIALRIDEAPEDFEALLRGIAQRLEASGRDGTFDLLAHDPRPPLPELVDLLECRLRVDGERDHLRGPNWGWRAAPDAFGAGVDAAIDWCAANAPASPLALAVGLIGPVPIPARQDARPYVHSGLRTQRDAGVVRLTSGASERFRVAAIEQSWGRISLIEGGSAIAQRAREETLESLAAFCRSAASWAAYAYIKRGSRRIDAELGSLFMDWLPIPHHSANARLADAFEDRFAPDAFGAQLLGRGYVGRVPNGPDWKHTQTGENGVLVEHRDPSAWFDGSLVPFGGHPLVSLLEATVPIPDLVTRARDDFKPILFTDDIALAEGT